MNTTLSSVGNAVKGAISPFQSVADASIRTIDQISKLQIESSKIYMGVGFSQMRKLTELRNMNQAKEFTWAQLEPLSEINKQLACDWKNMVAINNTFKAELKASFKKPEPEAMPKSVKKAATKTKRATKKASS